MASRIDEGQQGNPMLCAGVNGENEDARRRSRHDSAASFTPGTPVSPVDAEGMVYLHEASSCAAKAHACEAQGDFVGAFSLYKVAVSSLLEGVQSEWWAASLEEGADCDNLWSNGVSLVLG